MSTVSKACTRCHETRPLEDFPPDRRRRDGLDSRCRACKREATREANRRWYAVPENRERERKRTREALRRRRSTPEGREAAREASRRRYATEEGLAAHREANRRWIAIEGNRERQREAKRRRRSTEEGREVDREASLRWQREHPEAHVARSHRRRALKRAGGSYSVRDWERLVRRHEGRCAYCAEVPEEGLTVDHVVPLSRGGTNTIGNLLPACGRCNRSKGARLLVEWRHSRVGAGL